MRPDDEIVEERLAQLAESEGIDAAADHLLANPTVLADAPRTAVLIAQVIEEFRPDAAAVMLESAAGEAEKVGDWLRAGEWLQLSMVAHSRRRDDQSVDRVLAKVLRLIERVEDDLDRLSAGVNLAARLNRTARSGDGRGIVSAVVDEIRPLWLLDHDPEVGRVFGAALVNLACGHLDVGKSHGVGLLLDEACEVYTRLDADLNLGNVAVNRAMLASNAGQIGVEREQYVRAVDHFRRANAPAADIAFALRGAAASHAQVGRLPEAISYYVEALELFVSGGELNEARRTETALLMARWSNGDDISDEELATFGTELDEMTLWDAADRARNLANIHAKAKRYDDAVRLYDFAIDAFDRLARPVEKAKTLSSRAAPYRLSGRLDLAESDLQAALPILEQYERWPSVATIHHNLALVGRDKAGRDGLQDATSNALLHSLEALRVLDEHRHSLPTAADREFVLSVTYEPVFPLAVDLALSLGDGDLVAALIERSRVQPVLPDTPNGGAFRRPAPVRARPRSRVVSGFGPPVTLSTMANRLVGEHGMWVGWWQGGSGTITSTVTQDRTVIETISDPDYTLALLALASPMPTDLEIELAAGHLETANRMATMRAAAAPLCRSPATYELLAATFRPTEREAVLAQLNHPLLSGDDRTLLWEIAKSVLPNGLLVSLQAHDGSGPRQGLLLAPIARHGRIPWAALPIEEPRQFGGLIRRLVDVADVVVTVPASLLQEPVAQSKRKTRRSGHVAVIDPTGDLPACRSVTIEADAVRLGHGHRRATRQELDEVLSQKPHQLTIIGHVVPGRADDPAASAVVLGGELDTERDFVTVEALSQREVPPVCVLLGCDSAGAATGNEWTGPVTGLIWGGAHTVIATVAPVLDDRHAAPGDTELLGAIRKHGALEGLWSWQRSCARRWDHGDREEGVSPYRWATVIVSTVDRRSRALVRR
jgi:tetratricopeptide (TPR) repeat protein